MRSRNEFYKVGLMADVRVIIISLKSNAVNRDVDMYEEISFSKSSCVGQYISQMVYRKGTILLNNICTWACRFSLAVERDSDVNHCRPGNKEKIKESRDQVENLRKTRVMMISLSQTQITLSARISCKSLEIPQISKRH